jgi:hypothetical protein
MLPIDPSAPAFDTAAASRAPHSVPMPAWITG